MEVPPPTKKEVVVYGKPTPVGSAVKINKTENRARKILRKMYSCLRKDLAPY